MKKFIKNVASIMAVGLALNSTVSTAAAPSNKLLTGDNHALILIDHQPQTAFGVTSIPVDQLINNVTGLAKAAKAFNVPTVLTTVAAKGFTGPIFPSLAAVFPDEQVIDRTNMNTWEDDRVVNKIKQFGKKKLVMAALWTEVCGVLPVLSALDAGYEVYFVTDASGGTSKEAHDMAVQRMIQAGAVPLTWQQYMFEMHRDWARADKYVPVTTIAKEHTGSYGLGIGYHEAMFGGGK